MPFIKGKFKKQIINIDLAELNKVDDSKESIAGTNAMLNVNELRYTLDSLNKNLDNEIVSFSENINQRVGIRRGPQNVNKQIKKNHFQTTCCHCIPTKIK